jgi:hypothetical protein
MVVSMCRPISSLDFGDLAVLSCQPRHSYVGPACHCPDLEKLSHLIMHVKGMQVARLALLMLQEKIAPDLCLRHQAVVGIKRKVQDFTEGSNSTFFRSSRGIGCSDTN